MFISKYLTILLFLFVSLQGYTQENPYRILSEYQRHIAKHKNVHYIATFKHKFFTIKDTVYLKGECFLTRNKHDTLIGGNVSLTSHDSLKRLYEGKILYEINDKSHTITKFDKTTEIEQNIHRGLRNNMIWWNFISPEKLNTLISEAITSYRGTKDNPICGGIIDSSNIKFKGYGEIRNEKCYIVSIVAENGTSVYDYYISLKNYMLLRHTFHAYFQEKEQHSVLDILSYDFAKNKKQTYELKEEMKTYTFQKPIPSEMATQAGLGVGMPAPPILGIKDNQDTVKINYSNKLTLLDFWYMECYPCILNIPEVEKLFQTYKNTKNIQIFGINNLNNNSLGKENLPNFLLHNTINYPNLFVEKGVDKSFGIQGYPTILLIDKQGIIVYKQLGFHKNAYSEISTYLENNK